MSRFRPAGFRNGRTAWRRASRPDTGRPARRRSTAFRDGWTAWRRRASRNPAAPRNAVSPWEAGVPRSAASRREAAANPWLGTIARCSCTGSSNPSPSSGESTANLTFGRIPSQIAKARCLSPRTRHLETGGNQHHGYDDEVLMVVVVPGARALRLDRADWIAWLRASGVSSRKVW